MSNVDMVDIINQIGEVVDAFQEKMKGMYEEEPDSFARFSSVEECMVRIPELEWNDRVESVGSNLMEAITQCVTRAENRLLIEHEDVVNTYANACKSTSCRV